MNIYVGNLSRETSEESLNSLFAEYGDVSSAKVIKDFLTGESRGFGFVEMSNDEEAQKAMEALNGKDFEGRSLVVNEARPKKDNRGGGRGGRGGGMRGGGGGRGGYNNR